MPDKLLPRDSFVAIIMGPSGVGKDTILAEMIALGKPPHFHHNKSWVTRKHRANEPADIYKFVDEAEFERAEAAGELMQVHKAVYGKWYAAPWPMTLPPDTVEVFILLPKAALDVKNLFPKAKIYLIEPPSSDELRRRLEARATLSAEDRDKRVKAAETELRDGRAIADFAIVNETGQQKETARKLHEQIKADWQAAQAAD